MEGIPVWARPIRSFPLSAMGQACDWIAVGLSNSALRALIAFSERIRKKKSIESRGKGVGWEKYGQKEGSRSSRRESAPRPQS